MNIGGFIGGIGRKIGSGMKTGVRKLGELQPDDGMIPMTPGFNPNASDPREMIARRRPAITPTAPAISDAPRMPMPAVDVKPPVDMRPNHPPLTGFDPGAGRMMDQEVAPIRDSVTIRPDAEPRLALMTGAPPMMPTPGLPQGGPDMSRRGVPLPALPNRGSEPTPWSPYDEARYDYVMKSAKRGPDGNLLGKDEGGGFKRTWTNSLQNALLGAANAYAANPQGGLGALAGGALGSGLGATFNPQAGLEQVFDAGPGREMMQNQARRDTEMDRQRKQKMGDLQIGNIESQIEGRRSQSEIARMNTERQQAVADSTIKLNRARTEAAQRGTPVKVDLYSPEKDVVESVQIYPNGRREVLGISGDSVIKGATLEAQNARDEANRASRERIAQMPARPRAGGATRTGGGDGIPQEARTEYTRVQRLKQQADAAWAKAKNPGPSDDPAALIENARAALADYNANAEDFGTAYGDYYETGTGKEGWAYIKPRAGGGMSSGQGAPRATVASDFVERVMKQLGVDRATAMQRIQNSGIQVQ